MFRLLAFTGLILSLFLIPPAYAQGKSKTGSGKATVSEKIFSRETIGIIAEVLGLGHGEEIYTDSGKGRGGGLPPGLAKRSQLPPGLAKMRSLPPGLSKSRLPYDLESLLPLPPHGTERFIIGGVSVVLVETRTGRVLDIMDGKVNKTKLSEAEKRSAETLRHKDRSADGNPDRPLVTGNIPSKEKSVKKEKKK